MGKTKYESSSQNEYEWLQPSKKSIMVFAMFVQRI